MKKFFKRRKKIFSQTMANATIFALLISILGPLSAVAGNPNSVVNISINTINGNVPSNSCFVGAVKLEGSGELTKAPGQIGQYRVHVDWGDGNVQKDIPITTTQVEQDSYIYTFSVSHNTFAITSLFITASIYHVNPQGQDGAAEDSDTVSVCVVPPTTAVLNVKKQVTNDNGGTAFASNFTLYVKQNGTDVSGSPFAGSDTIGKDFILNPGDYTVSEDSFTGYTQTGIAGNCTVDGTITVVAGQNYSCTISNNDNNIIVNQPPVLDPIGDKVIDELQTLSFTASATDPESNPLTFSAAGLPAGATIDAITGVFNWTPTEVQGPGDYPVTIFVSDGTSSDSETINIQVNEVNINPVASDIYVSTHLDTPLSIILPATDADFPTNTLIFSTGIPSYGTVSASGNPVTYTPESGYIGSDSFTFTVDDGNGGIDTKNVYITIDDTAPTLALIPDQSVDESTPLSFIASATDPDGDPITYSLEGSVPSGAAIDSITGVFSWTSNEVQGPQAYSFIVKATAGAYSDSKVVNITVNEINVSPIADDSSAATDEDAPVTITLSASDSDIPAQTLTYSIVTPPANGTLSAILGGQVTYTPNTNYNGPDSFTFKANDSEADSNVATVAIIVNSVNDAPVIILNGANPINFLVDDNFTDPGATASDIEDGDITANIVITGGVVDTSSPGTFTITYSVTDSGGLSASINRDVIITQEPVENTLALCTDSIDNDGDGLVDLDDQDCAQFAPRLTVTKVVVNDNGGTKAISDFSLFVGETPVISGVQNGFNAGAYIVSETEQTGYAATISGDCSAQGNITLSVGDVKTCVITNDDIAPLPSCGDGTCNSSETCSTCSQDCGECQEVVSGGGGGGGAYIWQLVIFNEMIGNVSSNQAEVNWQTNQFATSRVIYDTVLHESLGSSPNYGYAYSTPEDSNKVTYHTVVISGLKPNTTYYWRAVSHGSPEVFSREEMSFTTKEAPYEEGIGEEEEEPGQISEEIEAGEEEPAYTPEGVSAGKEEEPAPANSGASAGKEEPAGEEEEAGGVDLAALLAAIGDLFKLKNLWWLLPLLLLILIILYLLSRKKKKGEA